MLGSNVPTLGGISTGFKFGDEWGCECIQIYLTLSRRWDLLPLTNDIIKNFKKSWKESSVKQVIAHIPFLVNLASPNREIWKKSINRLLFEINRALKLNVRYLVLHPGNYTNSNRQAGLMRLINALNYINKRIDNQPVCILLETMSGQGTTLGSSFEEISYVLKNFAKSENLGVCLDTAHIFHAGYNMVGYKRYERVLQKFEKLIGLNKVKVIHLNDSKTELGSRVDRHACIGEGKIGIKFFHRILRDERFINIPKILEIPDRDQKSQESLYFLRKLQKMDHISELKKLPLQLSIEEIY